MSEKEADQAKQGGSLKDRVAEVLNGIRPYIQADGGDIELLSVSDDGEVKIRLQGACVGCAASAMTLSMGVERTLKEKIPEIKSVTAA